MFFSLHSNVKISGAKDPLCKKDSRLFGLSKLGLFRLISFHRILFILPALYYSCGQPNRSKHRNSSRSNERDDARLRLWLQDPSFPFFVVASNGIRAVGRGAPPACPCRSLSFLLVDLVHARPVQRVLGEPAAAPADGLALRRSPAGRERRPASVHPRHRVR